MKTRTHTSNLRRLGTIAAIAVLFLGACSSASGKDDATSSASTVATTGSFQVLPPDQFAEFIDAHPDAPLVNVHTPYEGHIEGTDDFIVFDQIGDWDGLPADKDAPFVLYCRSGNMSATATVTLAALGYTNIIDLAGGMNAWTASGRDLVLDEPAT